MVAASATFWTIFFQGASLVVHLAITLLLKVLSCFHGQFLLLYSTAHSLPFPVPFQEHCFLNFLVTQTFNTDLV